MTWRKQTHARSEVKLSDFVFCFIYTFNIKIYLLAEADVWLGQTKLHKTTGLLTAAIV